MIHHFALPIRPHPRPVGSVDGSSARSSPPPALGASRNPHHSRVFSQALATFREREALEANPFSENYRPERKTSPVSTCELTAPLDLADSSTWPATSLPFLHNGTLRPITRQELSVLEEGTEEAADDDAP